MAANGKPKGLFFTGIALMTIALIGTIVGVVLGFSKAKDAVDRLDQLASVPLGETSTYSGDGSDASIWYKGKSATGVACQVADSNGSSVTIDTTTSTDFTSGESSYASVGSFPTAAGITYDVTCSSEFSNGSYAVGNIPIGDLAIGAVLILGSLLGGFVLWAIGLVLWIISLVVRSSWKKKQQQPFGGPTMTPGSPFGQQPGTGMAPPPPGGYSPVGGVPSAYPPPPGAAAPQAPQPPQGTVPPPPPASGSYPPPPPGQMPPPPTGL